MKLRTWHGLAGGLAILWLFVRGITLEPTVIVGELLLGAVFGVPVAYLFRRLYPGSVDVTRLERAMPYAVLYVVAFLWELLTANVDVARRVLAPSMPIEPRVIELPLRVQTPLAITTIANSITLTPGTLTMDHDDATNTLYVHAIAGADPKAVVAPIRRWEDYALVIFDEERKPGDPVPEPADRRAPRDVDSRSLGEDEEPAGSTSSSEPETADSEGGEHDGE